jgi:2'-5' RNA ligase
VDDRSRHATQVRDHWWWRPGWRVGRRAYAFHVTFDRATVSGGDDLRRLAAGYQAGLAGCSGMDPIPLQWLHLTMQRVGFTDEVRDHDAAAIAAAARRHCALLEPIDLVFGAVTVWEEAVVLQPEPAEPVRLLRQAVRATIAEVLGAGAVAKREDDFTPHVSLAYISQDGPAAPVVEVMERSTLAPARVRVRAASLIVIDRDERVYRWRVHTVLPLGGLR